MNKRKLKTKIKNNLMNSKGGTSNKKNIEYKYWKGEIRKEEEVIKEGKSFSIQCNEMHGGRNINLFSHKLSMAAKLLEKKKKKSLTKQKKKLKKARISHLTPVAPVQERISHIHEMWRREMIYWTANHKSSTIHSSQLFTYNFEQWLFLWLKHYWGGECQFIYLAQLFAELQQKIITYTSKHKLSAHCYCKYNTFLE